MTMNLAKRNQLLTPPSTGKIRGIANSLKEAGVHVINFAAGELDVDTTETIKQAAKAAVDAGRNVYTPALGLGSLRALVARKVSECSGAEYLPSEVGITAGAKQALYNSAMVLFDPGDEVIVPQPYWVTFPAQLEIVGARPVFVDTRPAGYHLLASEVERALTPRTRGIIINTPNNPTGAVYAAEELLAIARLALERDFWIVFDECYASLVREGHVHANIVKVCPEVKERVVLVNSFSKSHALTGWRVGYVAAPAPVIKAMENLQGHTTSNPNSIAQYAVEAALRNENAEFIAGVNRLLDERVALVREIVDEMDGISMATPEGAFYLFVDIQSKIGKRFRGEVVNDVDRLCELALSGAQVAAVAGSAFGDPSAIRVSYAISTQDVLDGFRRLQAFFGEIQ
jgi:aspartate aminotransferase